MISFHPAAKDSCQRKKKNHSDWFIQHWNKPPWAFWRTLQQRPRDKNRNAEDILKFLLCLKSMNASFSFGSDAFSPFSIPESSPGSHGEPDNLNLYNWRPFFFQMTEPNCRFHRLHNSSVTKWEDNIPWNHCWHRAVRWCAVTVTSGLTFVQTVLFELRLHMFVLLRMFWFSGKRKKNLLVLSVTPSQGEVTILKEGISVS